MAKPSLPQFDKDYDFYKMRTLVDELNRWIERVESGVVLGTSGLSNGGGGVTVHNDLTGRSAANAHPTSAITGLDAAQTVQNAAIAANAAANLVNSNHQRGWFERMNTRSLVHSEFVDEPAFLQVEGLRSVAAGLGAGSTGVVGGVATDHPGVWQLHTGVAATGRTFLISSFVSAYHVGVGGITRFGAWVQVPILSTGVDRFTARAGLYSIVLPNTITHGIGFEYDDSQNGGRWQGITNAAGETSLDTGILVTAGTWFFLEWECNTDGTSVEFFIDEVSVGTIAVVADIPAGSGFEMFTNIHIMKLIGLLDRHFYIDAYYVYQEITR